MIRFGLPALVPIGAALLASATLAVWLRATEAGPMLATRVPVKHPGSEGPAAGVQRNTGTLIPGHAVPSGFGGEWTQFRGADRTNIVHGAPRLARSWPETVPASWVKWTRPATDGHSGAAIRDGRVYMMDYDREKLENIVLCLSSDDGTELWRWTYYTKVKRQHGMSRTVPALGGDYVVTLGPKAHVVCLRADDGTLVWQKDLVREHGTVLPGWDAGQCPLIDGDRVILAPGGDPLMMAVELASGRVVWQTPNPGGWGMTHSSIVALDRPDGRQFICCTTQGIVGVSADDGRLLWSRTDWKITLANVPTPIVVGPDRVFVSGGYNAGCAMIKLASATSTDVLWRLPASVFASDQQTPILFGGNIYGVIPKGSLACIDLDGNPRWSSGAAHRFGLGPFLLADGVLLILHDRNSTLYMVDAGPDGYNELTSTRISELSGHDAWGPMAMVCDGQAVRLVLRDATRVVCLELPTEP